MSRPPDGTEARSKMMRTRITPTEHRKLVVAKKGTSESDYLRRLINEDFKRQGL